jgi:hypothetical protein
MSDRMERAAEAEHVADCAYWHRDRGSWVEPWNNLGEKHRQRHRDHVAPIIDAHERPST